MAVTTLDGIIAGAKPMQYFHKTLSGTMVIGRPYSYFYNAGIPGAAVAPASGVNGAALTSYLGQLPFTNPGGGSNTNNGRFATSATIAGTVLLCDRLWHNSGLSVTSTSGQSITFPTLPARDNDGATAGAGILIGMEIVTATGAGANVPSIVYTNSAGTGSKAGAMLVTYAASSLAGTFYPFSLAAGDVGVRSVETFTNSISMTSGSISLVAYRVLAAVDVGAYLGNVADPITGGFARMYDNSVPFLLFIPGATTTSSIWGGWTPVQG